MYNYSKILTYKNSDVDTLYRKELLECFYLSQYSDDINSKITQLYNEVKEYYSDIIDLIRKNNPFIAILSAPDDITCFTFLFSWEYFDCNHKILQSIKNNSNTINKKILVLKTKLERLYSNKK